MEPKQQRFSLWYFLAALMIMLAIQNFLFAPHTENLAYSDFKALVKAGKVADLSLSERAITGRLKQEGLEKFLPKEKIEEL
jgi:cell division protease FtsH